MQVRVKVVPGASREGIEWQGGVLKIKVRSAPEKGRANGAVEALLAERLDLPQRAVRIVAGFASPLKRVEIAGIDETQLRARLGQARTVHT